MAFHPGNFDGCRVIVEQSIQVFDHIDIFDELLLAGGAFEVALLIPRSVFGETFALCEMSIREEDLTHN